MFASRSHAIQDAMTRALNVRQSQGLRLQDPVCILDLTQSLGIEVRLMSVASMEGLYFRVPTPLIAISIDRPRGRRSFNCAHELGHHVYGHGNCVDELLDQRRGRLTLPREELLADAFAGYLLMPKSTVMRAFSLRGWDPLSCTPRQVFTVAGWLDVGYETLLFHMSRTLQLISLARAQVLARTPPKRIRSEILGGEVKGDLVIVDDQWYGRAVDIEVGDLIHAPVGTVVEGACVVVSDDGVADSVMVKGVMPGRGRLLNPVTGWSSFVRVSRRGFTGRAMWRHLEECDE